MDDPNEQAFKTLTQSVAEAVRQAYRAGLPTGEVAQALIFSGAMCIALESPDPTPEQLAAFSAMCLRLAGRACAESKARGAAFGLGEVSSG